MSQERRPGLRERLWWAPAPSLPYRLAGAPLLLVEGLFRAGAAARGALYDARIFLLADAGVLVISVGNLAVGEAGKTPVALAIAGRLDGRGAPTRRPLAGLRGDPERRPQDLRRELARS